MSNWFRRKALFYTPKTGTVVVEKPKRCCGIFCFLLRGLRRVCIFLGAISLIFILLGMWSATHLAEEEKPSLPKQMVLFLRMEKSLPERAGTQDYLSQLGLAPEAFTVSELVDSLDKAAHDDRVKGFVLSLRSNQYELAQLQEIRNAILKFKASGKFTKIYAPSYGDSGSGLGMYYLASVFDEIWMQPVGDVSIAGLDAHMPYFKSLLDKYGVKAQFFQRKEYKNAMENLTANQMSPASREEMNGLIGDLGDQVATDIDHSRKKIAGRTKSLIDEGLFTDDQALKEGLIDRLDYGDVLLSELRVKLDGSEDSKTTGFTDIRDYLHGDGDETHNTKSKVAVIYVEGVITENGGASPLTMEDKSANSTELAQAIRDAGNDKHISVIVLRVNSPGGSPSASETIRRAIIWTQEKKHKPVYVSMGSLAASGGYWMSADANRIYADNATLTGSIGVVGGKFDLSGLFEKYNINWDGISYGQNAGMWSMNRGFTPMEQARFEATLDNIYDHFITIVSKGRKMTPAQVEKIAKGRAWTGREAVKIGLVDEIGGFDKVMDDIAKAQGVENRHKLTVVELPEPESPLETFYEMIGKKTPFDESALPPGLMQRFEAFLPFLTNDRLVYTPLPKF